MDAVYSSGLDGMDAGQMMPPIGAGSPVPALVTPLNEFVHDEVVYRLLKLALAAGLGAQVGRKEQGSVVHGERLGSLAGGEVPPLAKMSDGDRDRIGQIDCIFYRPLGEPLFAFQIQGSTATTTSLDRFLSLLKAFPRLAGSIVIVVPKTRKRLLIQILKHSHYVGHPMYMENKIALLSCEDLLKVYDAFAGRQPPTPESLKAKLDGAIGPVVST